MFKSKHQLVYFLLLVSTVGLDQLSKIYVRINLDLYAQIAVIGKYFIITHVENTGAFLSVGSNLPEFLRQTLLLILPCFVLVYSLYYLFTKPLRLYSGAAISLLIGGGIGNIIDRIFNNAVTDFLFMDFVLFKTGVFNLADVFIMTGIALLLKESLIPVKQNKKMAT